MTTEGIANAIKVLNTGLFGTMLWLLMSGSVYHLLYQSKPWGRGVYGFYGCSLLAIIGVSLVGMLLLWSPFKVWLEDKPYYYSGVSLLMLLATTLVLAVFTLWVFLLIQRGGIWPPEWPERVLRLIPSVASLILLATLLVASYLRFR
jgi:hypothetical protein